MYALLVAYQALRLDLAEATHPRRHRSRPASFAIAPKTARDLIIQAAGVIADTGIDRLGTIGRRILADVLPDRRIRIRDRVAKRATSRYDAKGAADRTT